MALMRTWRTAVWRCVEQHVAARGPLLPALGVLSSPVQSRPVHTSPVQMFQTSPVQRSSNTASVVRCGRQKYERLYPVLLVRPDGSTINIRYREPRRILMMPVDITTLSEAERKARLKKRDVRRTVAQKDQDEIQDSFREEDYSRFWRK